MSHTLSTNTCLCDLNTTTVADYALIANLLVFTTMAFPVLARSEDLFTE